MDVQTIGPDWELRSAGHVGWSWTYESGIVEVIDDGASILRAPLNNAFAYGRRIGREWWPNRDAFRGLWTPLTFSTVEDARRDMEAAR